MCTLHIFSPVLRQRFVTIPYLHARKRMIKYKQKSPQAVVAVGQKGRKMSAKYYTVYGFMWDELGLSGNELAVFAVIYSYSSDGRGRFLGSRSVLGQMVGRSPREVDRVIARLLDRGYVEKRQENTHVGVSFAVAPWLVGAHRRDKVLPEGSPQEVRQTDVGVRQTDVGARQTDVGGTTYCRGGYDRMAHNNKFHNKSYNKSTINGRGGAQERSYRYNFMTKEEYKRWAEEACLHAQNRPLDDDDDD